MAKLRGEPKLTNCTPVDVFRALNKLGGFKIIEGSLHTKVVHLATGKSSTIPRHGKVNRYLLRDFIDNYLCRDLEISKKEIYKYLWC
jgi:hypothetical protein